MKINKIKELEESDFTYSTTKIAADTRDITENPSFPKISYRAGQRRLRTENFSSINTPELLAKPTPEEVASVLSKYNGPPSSVIFEAAKCGDLTSVRILLDFGFNPVAEGGYYNVVDFACQSSNISLLKYLIEEKGIRPLQKDPFYVLITRPNIFSEGIELLLSKGYKFSATAIINSLSSYPDLKALNFLIQKNADISCLKDEKYSTILIRLPMDLMKRISSLGIKLNLNIKTEIAKSNIPKRIEHNGTKVTTGYDTLLLAAIANHDTERVQNLLSLGADPNFKGQESIWYFWRGGGGAGYWDPSKIVSPLQLANEYGFKDITIILLNNGANS